MFVVNTLITDLEVSITLIVHCSCTLSKTAAYKCQSNLNFSNVSSDLVEDGGYVEGVVGYFALQEAFQSQELPHNHQRPLDYVWVFFKIKVTVKNRP